MSMTSVTLDPERQEQAKIYSRIRRRLMVVELVIGGIYALAWLGAGWSLSLRDELLSITDNQWILVAAFGLIFGGIYFVLALPLSYYSGFVLPHRFGLSTQTRKGWTIDQLKGIAIGVVLGGIILEIIYALLRAAPDIWWVWTGIVLLLFNVILANIAPVILFPIFFKFVPIDEEHAELVDRLMHLAERADTYVKGVYQFDLSRRTTAANAGLAGLGNTRRIILGDTLIDEFTPDEIETVLAHELGHHVHKDIPIGILVESVITFVGLFIAYMALGRGAELMGFNGQKDVAAMPLLILVMGFYGLLTMPLGNAYSRWRERLADAFAIKITGSSSAYASALTRLANQNLADADPEPWVEFLLYSHPALGKRIAVAESMVETSSLE